MRSVSRQRRLLIEEIHCGLTPVRNASTSDSEVATARTLMDCCGVVVRPNHGDDSRWSQSEIICSYLLILAQPLHNSSHGIFAYRMASENPDGQAPTPTRVTQFLATSRKKVSLMRRRAAPLQYSAMLSRDHNYQERLELQCSLLWLCCFIIPYFTHIQAVHSSTVRLKLWLGWKYKSTVVPGFTDP